MDYENIHFFFFFFFYTDHIDFSSVHFFFLLIIPLCITTAACVNLISVIILYQDFNFLIEKIFLPKDKI